MGSSTNAYISFGYNIGESKNAPWVYNYEVDESTYKFDDGDYEEWWRSVKPFVPTLEIYDEKGSKLPFITKEQEDKYWEENRAFHKLRPMPFELKNSCSGDYPMYILAVPDAGLWASRGDPEKFNPEDLKVDEEKLKLFKEFVKEYFPKLLSQKPSWWLSSYHG